MQCGRKRKTMLQCSWKLRTTHNDADPVKCLMHEGSWPENLLVFNTNCETRFQEHNEGGRVPVKRLLLSALSCAAFEVIEVRNHNATKIGIHLKEGMPCKAQKRTHSWVERMQVTGALSLSTGCNSSTCS